MAVVAFALAAISLLGRPTSVSALGPAATFQPKTAFADVSCASSRDCTAVGSYGTGWIGPGNGPHLEPIYAIETAGVWGKAIKISAPSGDGVFTGLSCSSASDCTAVGYGYNGQYDNHGLPEIGNPFYATETAGKWSAATEITSATGQGAKTAAGAAFNSVSCTSAMDCTAVGGGSIYAMYATESGGVWGPVTFVTTPTGAGDFTSVSCSSATDCTAVGDDETCDCQYGFFVPNAPIYASEVGGTWGAAAEVVAPYGSIFNGVSCTSAEDCTAVGAANGNALYATESGGTWPPSTEPTMPGYASLTGISCTSATACIAVGTGTNPAYSATYDVSVHIAMAAGKWGSEVVDGGGAFSKISCASAAACTAVGSFDLCGNASTCADPGSYATYATDSGGTWTDAPTPPRISRVIPVDRGVKIFWTAGASHGRPPVAGYAAIAVLRTHGLFHEFLCTTARTSCTIGGLTDGRIYTISVFARDTAGLSASSAKRAASPHR
jgi:hypothetical protein